MIAYGVESEFHRIDPSTHERTVVSHIAGDVNGLSVSDDGSVVGFLASTPDRPDDLYVLRGGSDPARVSNFHTVLDDITLGPQEVLTWERAGVGLDGILIWPPGKSRADGPLPCVVSIHGGPYGRWPNEFITRFGRWIAQHGYLVFLPNPRGGMGHGAAFAESVRNTVGNEDYLDIMSGVDLLVEQGLADPDRLGCGGWSQGGFMTAWIVGQTTRFKAGVMGAGVSDWGMMIATSDIPTYEQYMGGGNPYEGAGPHSFDAQSPVSFVSNATTPVLIVHGENDERVPVTQGIHFFRGLRRYGVPTELVDLPTRTPRHPGAQPPDRPQQSDRRMVPAVDTGGLIGTRDLGRGLPQPPRPTSRRTTTFFRCTHRSHLRCFAGADSSAHRKHSRIVRAHRVDRGTTWRKSQSCDGGCRATGVADDRAASG